MPKVLVAAWFDRRDLGLGDGRFCNNDVGWFFDSFPDSLTYTSSPSNQLLFASP